MCQKKRRCEIDRQHVVTFSLANGRAALATLLERAPGFTAVIGGNDPLVIGALLECRARGIHVPGEMSIAGIDDIELAAELASTTVMAAALGFQLRFALPLVVALRTPRSR